MANYEKTKLQKGTANSGVYIHSVCWGGGKFRFVEKRGISPRELEFYKWVKDGADRTLHFVPSVYDVKSVEDEIGQVGGCALLEYFPEVGRPVDLNDRVMDSVVDSIVNLNGLDYPSLRNTCSSLERRIEAKAPLLHKSVDQFYLRRYLELKNRYYAQYNVGDVVSHNDIYWSNMSFVGAESASPRCVLIDYGLICLNLRGAEFHHFFRYSRSDSDDRIADELCEKYALVTSTTKGEVIATALYFSAVRSLERYYMRGMVAEEENALKGLLDRLSHELR